MVFWKVRGSVRPQLTLVILVFAVGCSHLAVSDAGKPLQQIETTSIQSLQDPTKKDSMVSIQGKVGDRAPLLNGALYELQDASGTVWVLTKQDPPSPGQEVVIQGIVRFKSIPLNGKDVGSIYIEQQ